VSAALHHRPELELRCHEMDRPRTGARVMAPCGRFLGYSDRPVSFIATAKRAPMAGDGRKWVYCGQCNTWNVFEVSE
jgi:hypothetical protein